MPYMAAGEKPPIRVLWLAKGLGPGGAERLLVSFAALADRERFDLRAAYLLPWKNHLVTQLADLGVPAFCLDSRREADLRWVQRLRKLVRAARIDVVHVHSPMVAALARPALRVLPRRERPALIGTEHNVWSSHHPVTRWANRLTLPLEEATVAVSDEVRASMPARLGRRAEVVIHGVDVDAIFSRRGNGRLPGPRSACTATSCWSRPSPTSGPIRTTRPCSPPPDCWSTLANPSIA